jgi:hypothetical protein
MNVPADGEADTLAGEGRGIDSAKMWTPPHASPTPAVVFFKKVRRDFDTISLLSSFKTTLPSIHRPCFRASSLYDRDSCSPATPKMLSTDLKFNEIFESGLSLHPDKP